MPMRCAGMLFNPPGQNTDARKGQENVAPKRRRTPLDAIPSRAIGAWNNVTTAEKHMASLHDFPSQIKAGRL